MCCHVEIKKLRNSLREGVPDAPESKPLKVLQVERRKIGHAKGREAERDPGVVDAATGEIPGGGTLPKLVVEFPAARREPGRGGVERIRLVFEAGMADYRAANPGARRMGGVQLDAGRPRRVAV